MFFPERHGELPEMAGANPEWEGAQVGAMAGTQTAQWSTHTLHPTGASSGAGGVQDPWASAYDSPATIASGGIPIDRHHAVPVSRQADTRRFAASDLVTVAGVLLLYAAVLLPWAQRVTTEGEDAVVTAGSFPLSFIFQGFADHLPAPWLTAFTILAFAGLVAVVGVVSSNRPTSANIVSAAGIVALLVPAAILVKLASLQEEVEVKSGFTHGIGIYVALVAALLILTGATLRSSRLRRKK